MKQVCIARMKAFGQAGNAGKIKPVTTREFARVLRGLIGWAAREKCRGRPVFSQPFW
jgi:hypothetical protein